MNYNKSQQEAIRHVDGPMLVLAGPGSGKTAVITQRTKNLITEAKVKPSEILVITFTKAAAAEMKGRFERLMNDSESTSCNRTCSSSGNGSGNIAGNVSFGTFHAVFFTILKAAYHFTAANIITSEQRYRFMREIISRYHLEYQDEAEMISGLLGEISSLKNSRTDPANFYSSQCSAEIFRKIYADYENRMHRSRLIDFDDMLTYTYELFTQRKDILAAWQKKYKYILIDEFQDINRIQYEIIRMLALPQNNLFIVGDDDQSIYRFRGSMPEIMLGFQKDYPDAVKVLLDTNYRCPPYVVETSLNLISHNTERFPKEIHAAGKSREPVKYVTFQNRHDENLYVLKEIEERVKEGVKLSDIAVLFRTNNQPQMLTETMATYNLAFRMKDHMPNLYEHWIAKDIFTYLQIARGSRAREDFLQIMNRPKRYLSRDSLCDTQVDFDEWEKLYDEQPWIAERIVKLAADLRLMSRMSPYAAINYLRRGVGYDDFIGEFAENKGIEKADLIEILDEIQMSAKGYASYADWEEHIREYTARMKAMAAAKAEMTEAVTLSTLHSSKGLEFDTVIIIDANEGIMPYKKAIVDKDIEEERRLFYVGMTRAKAHLCICSVKSLHDKNASISRFVAESKEKAGEKTKQQAK